MISPFILDTDNYKRNYDIIGGYVEQSAFVLHKLRNIDLKEATAFVADTISPKGTHPLHNPDSIVLEQVSRGNRERIDRPFFQFLKDVVEHNYILSPAMIAYMQPSVRKSTSASFTVHGINGRKFSKNEMFEAQKAGDKVREAIKNSEQNAKKIDINALSGMAGFSANVLYVKSGHPSLTSMCRSATSYGNAINEKFLGGNRHYENADLILADIAGICTLVDLDKIAKVIHDNDLIVLTPEQLMQAIRRSSDLYMVSENELDLVKELVYSLTDVERAAVAYTSDFYTFAKYNDAFARKLMHQLISVTTDTPADIDGVMKSLNGDEKAFVALLTAKELRKVDQNHIKEKSPEIWATMATKAASVGNWYNVYREFVEAFWRPEFLPQSVGNIEHMVRRAVLTSDTDSTIFTTQYWVEWYTGTLERTDAGDKIWYSMTFISTQLIVHGLAMLSANMGVDKSDLFRLAMKNEYAFPVFALTTMAKHYYAFMSAQEGAIFVDYKMEIKGKNLRSSTVNPDIIEGSTRLMRDIMTAIDTGQEICIDKIYDEVYEREIEIDSSIRKGESKYLSTAQIKSVYSNPKTLSTPLFHYEMWNEVFAGKYGEIPEPPIAVVKVPLILENKTEIKEWLDSWPDTDLRNKMRAFLGRTARTKFTMVMLPSTILHEQGIPEEIMLGVNTRRLTYHALSSYYMTLESLGLHKVDEDNHILVQDFHDNPTIRAKYFPSHLQLVV